MASPEAKPETPLRVAFLVDEKWYTQVLADLAQMLQDTGLVHAQLIMCRDSAPDPERALPFVRFNESDGLGPAHEYDWDDITGYERFLAPWDDYFLNRWEQAARTLAAQAERRFAEQRPDCIVVWSGTRLDLRAVTAVARRMGIAVVTMESPYFQKLPDPPETDFVLDVNRMKHPVMIWDTIQAPQCGPSQLTRDWRQAQTRPGLQAFFEQLHAERVAKFSREDIQNFLGKSSGQASAAGSVDTLLFKPPETRALLVLGQVSRDSARYFGEHLVEEWHELGLAVAKNLPPGWIVWFKGHPLDRRYAEEAGYFAQELHEVNPLCRVLPNTIDIHACYQRCDAVACINSTATIEAATYQLPVINFGWAAFTDIGMSYKLHALDELAPLLESLPERMTPEQLAVRDQFLSYVLYDYLIPVGSPRRIVERMRQAIAEAAQGAQ